jgi:hypothetical protein
VTDSLNNVHFEKNGVTITTGLTIGTFSFTQTTDSLLFSLLVTDDSQVASVTANLTSVKGTSSTIFKKMNIDSFYVSLPIMSVTSGTKSVDFTITDNSANVIRVYKTFLVHTITASTITANDYSLQLYPNPTKGILYVGSGFDFFDIAIYNLLGLQCLNVKHTSLLNQMDISSLSEGYYICSVTSPKGVIEKSFVIAK